MADKILPQRVSISQTAVCGYLNCGLNLIVILHFLFVVSELK